MEDKIIITRTHKFWMDKDGVVRNEVLPDKEITLADAKISVQMNLKIMNGKKCPVFIDSRQIKAVTSEARQYFASYEANSISSAVAILVNSSISRIIGSFFINFNKPHVPTRLFTDENEAIAWLKGFLK